MTIKSERLEKRIQEIQQFVNDRIKRDQIFEVVSQELAKIVDALKQGKLTVQIVSQNPVTAQKLQNSLNKYPALGEYYRFSPILRICDFNSADDQQLADCNVLCLIIAHNQMHKLDQMQLLQKVSKTHVSILVVVVDMPEITGETDIQVNSIKDKVRAWLQNHNDNVQKIETYSNCESDLEIFCHSLGTLTKRKAEDILIKQFTAQLLTQLILLESFLTKQVREIEAKIQQDQASLQIVGGEQYRRQFDETIRLINYDKASIIREIKSSVNQSVTDLLDKFFRDSIICQLRSYVYALESEIIKRKEGHVYIRLVKRIKKKNKYYVKKQENISNNYTEARSRGFVQKNQKQLKLTINSLLRFGQTLLSNKSKYKIVIVWEDSVDANTVLTEYYRQRLKKWAAKEWENVCNIYAEGGLRRFLQTAYERFKLIPCLNIESSFWEPSQYIDISHNFARSIEKPNCETSYRKISLLGFIFGRIRNNLMPFLTISFSLSILGIANRRQITRWFFQPVFSAFEYAPFLTIIILTLVIYFLIKALFENYNKHNLAEMKKAEVKLKDELFQFYSGLVQHLTDKIRQEILSSIEAKEQGFDENVQAYRQLLDQTNEPAGSDQILLRKRIEQQKEDMKSLNQELGDLQRLKRRNLS